jgi:hypothetical protein
VPEKSVADRLLIKAGYRVLPVNEPYGYRARLGGLPQDVVVTERADSPADLIQFFVSSRHALEAGLPGLKKVVKPRGLLWVTYPKATSKTGSDINRDSIAAYALSIGLQAVAMISIDDVWSGLRLKTVG